MVTELTSANFKFHLLLCHVQFLFAYVLQLLGDWILVGWGRFRSHRRCGEGKERRDNLLAIILGLTREFNRTRWIPNRQQTSVTVPHLSLSDLQVCE